LAGSILMAADVVWPADRFDPIIHVWWDKLAQVIGGPSQAA